ncbi:MAG: hypothetical protein PHO15_07090 [Eubacteriales bacterium]|nr:hypothetical protein [Eubacteriales bacterium]
MALYMTVIGLGTLLGVCVSFLMNRNIMVHKIIGTVIILMTGALTFFVTVHPLVFNTYTNYIFMLLLAAVLLVTIFIVLRVFVNRLVTDEQANQPVIKYYKEKNVKKEKFKISSYQFTGKKRKESQDVKIAQNVLKEKVMQLKQTDAVGPKNKAAASISKPKILEGYKGGTDEAEKQQPQGMIVPEEFSEDTQARAVFGTEIQSDSVPHDPHEASLKTAVPEPEKEAKPGQQSQEETKLGMEEEAKAVQEPQEEIEVIVEPKEETNQEPQEEAQRYTAVVVKAGELMGQKKYLYAMHLLETTLANTQDRSLCKQADMMLAECLVLSGQPGLAQKKLFKMLNAYALSADDKMKLKEIMIHINTIKSKDIV